MKFFWITLGLLLIAAGVYFWLGTDSVANLSGRAGTTYIEFLKKLEALNNIKDKGVSTFNDVSKFAADAQDKFTNIKNFLENTPKTVSSTISDLYSQLPPSVVKLLSGETGESLQNFISPGGQFLIATTNGSFQGDVCVEFNNGSRVGYSVKNPFSPAKNYDYHVGWGDGVFADGKVGSGAEPLSLAHVYTKPGNYSNQFNITAASTTLGAQVRVCIR
jgi:hypothetical protein